MLSAPATSPVSRWWQRPGHAAPWAPQPGDAVERAGAGRRRRGPDRRFGRRRRRPASATPPSAGQPAPCAGAAPWTAQPGGGLIRAGPAGTRFRAPIATERDATAAADGRRAPVITRAAAAARSAGLRPSLSSRCAAAPFSSLAPPCSCSPPAPPPATSPSRRPPAGTAAPTPPTPPGTDPSGATGVTSSRHGGLEDRARPRTTTRSKGWECGTVDVPLDYAHPDGKTITLALTRLPATDEATRIGSLLVNPGGPGGSGIETVHFLSRRAAGEPEEPGSTSSGFDPRGVGASTPVDCVGDAAKDAEADLDPTPDTPDEITAIIDRSAASAKACASAQGDLLPYVGHDERGSGPRPAPGGGRRRELTYLGLQLRHDPGRDVRRPVPRQGAGRSCSTAPSTPRPGLDANGQQQGGSYGDQTFSEAFDRFAAGVRGGRPLLGRARSEGPPRSGADPGSSRRRYRPRRSRPRMGASSPSACSRPGWPRRCTTRPRGRSSPSASTTPRRAMAPPSSVWPTT